MVIFAYFLNYFFALSLLNLTYGTMLRLYMIYFNWKQHIGVISEIRVMTVKLPIASLIFQKGFSDAASS